VTKPLTHTIGYTLRPIVEGYLFSRDPAMLDAAMKTARAVCRLVSADGRLAGRLDKDWQPTSSWDCLTGSSQISICLLLLHRETGDQEMLTTALALNRFVRSTMHLTGSPGVVGGIKGSFPVSGAYGRFQFLSWATKFTIDAATLELELTKGQ
jgi:hypothetical protein